MDKIIKNINKKTSVALIIFIMTSISANLTLAEPNKGGMPVTYALPLDTNLITQPDKEFIFQAVISPVSKRTVLGLMKNPNGGPEKILINSQDEPASFKVLWEPPDELVDIYCLGWSSKEKNLGFMATTGSLQTGYAECWLYVIEMESQKVRKILKIGEATKGSPDKNLVDIPEKTSLAWLGENKICLRTNTNSIISVDSNNGQVETIVPLQDGSVRGPAAVQSDKLRFAKRIILQDKSVKVEIYEYAGSEVKSMGIIPSVDYAELSSDGQYAFCMPKDNFQDWLIFDISKWKEIKRIPRIAKDQSSLYVYMPIAVLNNQKLILYESRQENKQIPSPGRTRLSYIEL